MSFNNRVPGERLNSIVENLLLVGKISENPSASRCVSAQWERGEDWREVKNGVEMRKGRRGRKGAGKDKICGSQ